MPKRRHSILALPSKPCHLAYAKFCPAPGHGLGFNELKVIELAELLYAIEEKPSRSVNFRQGLAIERVIHAFASSSRNRSWIEVHEQAYAGMLG